MEAAVDLCFVDKNDFEIQIKQLSIDNDQLLKQIMSQEIVHIVVDSVDSFDVQKSCVNECNKCLELETKLFKKKDLIEKDVYDKLLKPQSQEKDTVIRKLKDLIKSLMEKEGVENVKKDTDETKTINIELEHSVAKLLSENKNLRKEREHLKSIYKDQFDLIKKTRVQSKEHCDSLIAQINAKSIENSDLNAQLQEKVFAITTLKNELRKLNGKNVVDTVVSKPNATIPPGMFKLDIEPISHRLKNNRDAHEVYIDKSIENTNTLHQFVESAKTHNPSEPLLEYACMFTKHVQEFASGSKPSGNTKNNRITRPPSSNQKNKVEDHSRKVKSSLNKKNSVSEPISNALVKHSVRNAKFESICAICNKCLFDANHDMCIIDYVNDVNLETYKRTFTIVGNRCPLTRITSTKVVPPKETTIAPVVTPTLRILVYSRRPKATRFVGSSSKVKIIEYKTSNSKEPKQSWGSTIFDVPSSSLNDCRFGNDHIAKIMGYGDYQVGNNDIVERRNHTLVEAARTMLIFSKASLFLWAEAVATACYTQNRSLIQKRHNKIPYELLHDRKPDLSYLHVFGALCYPTNDGEDLGKLKPKADIGIFLTAMASEQFSSGPRPNLLTPGTVSSGLVPNIPSLTSYVPQTKNDWEILFQPMFDEYLNPPPCVDLHFLAIIVQNLYFNWYTFLNDN
ncbi:retrovirus-related pol polyprotein from transposon TNT 1-94 [Tanacetum coccineum]